MIRGEWHKRLWGWWELYTEDASEYCSADSQDVSDRAEVASVWHAQGSDSLGWPCNRVFVGAELWIQLTKTLGDERLVIKASDMNLRI